MLLLLNDYNPQIALIWLLPLYLELDFFFIPTDTFPFPFCLSIFTRSVENEAKVFFAL